MSELSEVHPLKVFKYFEEICAIPHGTGHTEALSDYIEGFAKKLSLSYIRDAFGNIVIYKPASVGFEEKAGLILQEHLDMYYDRDEGSYVGYGTEKKGLELAVVDDYVYAKGSALGADGAIGIAYILSILESEEVAHPRLEALFTVDAEDGMRGIRKMDLSVISGRRMINLGHFTEGEILMGSAGGRKIALEVPVRYENEFGVLYDIVICGLRGGHSGLEIDKYRGNAGILMGRLLHYIDLYMDYSLAYLKGGMHVDYIPREAKASILVKKEDTDKLEDLIDEFNEALLKEYQDIEDNLTIYGENKGETIANVLTEKTKQRVIFLLMTIPDGIQKMNPRFENIVQTSSNLGILSLERDSFLLHVNLRSLLSSEKHAMSDKFQYLTETIGGTFKVVTNYHAWEYEETSHLRDIFIRAWEELYQTKPVLTMVHSGLECGVISDKLRDMDIVSIGPTIENVNTVTERLCISSLERVWDYLIKVLSDAD